MTAATVLDAPSRPAVATRVTFPRLLRSEWIKLATVRSTWWSIGVVAVLSVGMSVLIAASMPASGDESAGMASLPPVLVIVSPLQFTMLLAAVLGAISVTGEYATGMIRSTLAAAPRRTPALLAKAVVIAAFLFLASLAVFGLATLATAPLLDAAGLAIPWDAPAESLLPLLYGALAMAVFALIGLSCGFLVRNGAGAISIAVAIVFVLPILPGLIGVIPGWEWVQDAAQYLPMNAVSALTSPGEDFGLADGPALLALAGWVVAGLLGSWAVLRTRDA